MRCNSESNERKNHIYILKALKTLKEEYDIKIGAIFSGSDKGNIQYIQDSVDELELSEQVLFTGFVSNTEMRYLYNNNGKWNGTFT